MPQTLSESQKFDLRREITDHAKTLGFDLVGFSPAKIEEKYLKGFEEWLAAGSEGIMEYMRKIAQRRDINLLLPGAKTVIVFGLNYYHEQPPLPRGHGRLARYAYGRDYHKVIGKKLRKMEGFIAKIYSKAEAKSVGDFLGSPANQKICNPREIPAPSSQPATLPKSAHADFLPQKTAEESHTKSYVDTGPILERAYAEQAGLGRIGKNGCVISKDFGSWIFLSEIITTLDLNFDNTFPGLLRSEHRRTELQSEKVSPETQPKSAYKESHLTPGSTTETFLRSMPPRSRRSQAPPGRWSSPTQKSFNVCGNCNKCMTACPTGAIIAPGVVDSRLCISYLTIENKDKIPPKLAKIIKKTKRLYGCDICQEVCPHNHARQQIKSPPGPAPIGTSEVRQKIECAQVNLAQHTDLDGLLTPIAGDSLNISKLLKKSSRKSSSITAATQRTSPFSSDAAFLHTFAGSPLMRAKRCGLQRTAKIISIRPESKTAKSEPIIPYFLPKTSASSRYLGNFSLNPDSK